MNEIDQRKADKLKLEKYLNTNLAAYFRDKGNSIHGVPRSRDVFGELYKTYAYFNYDVNINYINGGWHSTLNEAKRSIDKIIDSLSIAKSCEKPEGGKVCQRLTEIHWRQSLENEALNEQTRRDRLEEQPSNQGNN